jgi:hypothetical protein
MCVTASPRCEGAVMEEEITDDGNVLQIILADIQQRAKKLRACYRDPGDDFA